MKRKVLAMLVPALLVAGAANAAEVYNKDGNKLDLYGKVAGLHTTSLMMLAAMATSHMPVSVSKVKLRSLINSLVTVSGNLTLAQTVLKATKVILQRVWHLQV